jgi:mannose-P-dolichol utilization defect protein 1
MDLLTDACYSALIKLFNVQPLNPTADALAAQCASYLLLSKLIGIMVILISPILKLPLIYSLADSKKGKITAEGLPYRMLIIELLSQSIGYAFNKRFGIAVSAYGELYFLIVQNLAILSCGFYLTNRIFPASTIWVGFPYLISILCDENWLSDNTLKKLIGLNFPLTLAGIVPVIWQNLKNRHTIGFPLTMLLLGQLMGIGRILTTIFEVGTDPFVLAGCCTGPVLNAILILQYFYYKDNTRILLEEAEEKEK